MEQASGWHCCCMVPQVTKLVTLVRISHSATQTLQAKTKNHRSRRQAEAKTTKHNFGPQKNHGQTTLEGKTVDFSPFWWIKDPLQQMPSRLTAVRNGFVSSVPKPMCGLGVADDVTRTSQPVCRESTRRLSWRRTKDGTQDHHLRVVEKRENIRIRKRGMKKLCVHKRSWLMSSKEWRRVVRCTESRREEEVVLKKAAGWMLRKRRTAKKELDEQRKSLQKQLRDI